MKEFTIKEVFAEVVDPPKDLVDLADQYKFSDYFVGLSHNTRKAYERYIIVLLRSAYGRKKPEAITPQTASLIYRNVKNQNGLATANLLVATWCRIYNYAISREWLILNPWEHVKRQIAPPRDALWTEDLVFKVVDKALNLGYSEVAKGIVLMYDTAQRPGDVLEMKHDMVKSDTDGPYIELRQRKTGKLIRVAITMYTARLIGDGRAFDFLVGKKMNLVDFRNFFKKVAQVVGIPSYLQLRDLRRTALTEMGNGGATDDEMMAQSGHKDRAMLDTYSVKTRNKALAAHRARYAERSDRFS